MSFEGDEIARLSWELGKEIAENERLRIALKDAIAEGCSCDLMNGYQCDIHKYSKYLEERK